MRKQETTRNKRGSECVCERETSNPDDFEYQIADFYVVFSAATKASNQTLLEVPIGEGEEEEERKRKRSKDLIHRAVADMFDFSPTTN